MTDDGYDAVVYDLDGTLVDLTVDWDAVRRDVDAALRDAGVETNGDSLWRLLDLAEETGHREIAEEAIADHECPGAESSTRLPLADALPHDVPVGVVSLNCERACRIALETHDIADHVQEVLGRDTVETYKPEPEGLLAAIDRLGAEPDASLFVGDSERDAETARRAGVAFQWARERQDSL